MSLGTDVDEARRVVASLRGEVATEEKRLAALRKLVRGYAAYIATPASSVPVRDDRPKGQEAVRIILEESSGTAFTVPDVVEAMGARGWLPPSADPAAALTRLAMSHGDAFRKERRRGTVVYVHSGLASSQVVLDSEEETT